MGACLTLSSRTDAGTGHWVSVRCRAPREQYVEVSQKHFGSDAVEEGNGMPEGMTRSYINLIAAYVVIGAFALTVPLTIAYLVVLEMLFHCMRKKHPDDYKRLGEPSLFMNNSISKGMEVVRFLIDRDYLDIPGRRASQLGALPAVVCSRDESIRCLSTGRDVSYFLSAVLAGQSGRSSSACVCGELELIAWIPRRSKSCAAGADR
jgi:hypothetical protein